MTTGTSHPWWRGIEPAAWRALAAAGAGWMLDAMDFMLYSFALEQIAAEFHLTSSQSGRIASVTLIAAAAAGTVSGFMADRFGRVRVLMFAILAYSVFTALTATSRSIEELILWRALVGVGLGSEWAAGAVLVAESWPAKHRGKAIGLMQSGWAIGYILAALLAGWVLPRWGWRPLFVLGLSPALLLVWIRLKLKEPAVWRTQRPEQAGLGQSLRTLARPPHLRRAAVASCIAAALLFAYWGLFTWLPAFLGRPEALGGAGLNPLKSTTWIVVMQVGSFLGYTGFGVLADRFGRRPTFIAFMIGAAAIVPLYGLSARGETTLLVLGPLVGFFGHGYFSVFGAMLAELFPVRIRGAATALCYNLGRAASAAAPWTIGALSERFGLGTALAATSVLYVVAAGLILLLPETRGKPEPLAREAA